MHSGSRGRSPSIGKYRAFRTFATATGAKCAVLVNGVEQEAIGFPNVKSWSKRKTGKLTLILKPGTNTIEIRNLGKRGVNLDYLDLKRVK